MARISADLRGSTVIECVVASIIMMVVFMAVMEIVVRLSGYGGVNDRHLEMVVAVKECCRDFSARLPERGDVVSRPYPWGIVRAEVKPYRGDVLVLVLKAIPDKGGREVMLRYLVKKKEVSKQCGYHEGR